MTSWQDLIGGSSDWAIGCYLWPSSILGDALAGRNYIDVQDMNEIGKTLTEITHSYSFGETEVKISRNCGLFVWPPDTFLPMGGETFVKAVEQRQVYERAISSIFDLFVAELNMRGYPSEPTAPVHISRANVRDNHALVAGSNSSYTERNAQITTDLLQNNWIRYRQIPTDCVDKAVHISWAEKLVDVSQTLPTLVSGAYYSYSRQQLPEALIDSFVVLEQYVDFLWQKFADSLSEPSRRKNLKDSRTYTTSVRLEMLFSIGLIDHDFYSLANAARKHRNSLAHGAKISFEAATCSMRAMHLVLRLLVDEDVDFPMTSTAVGW